ncbi:hypothetical protein BH23ACT11_BH23ACT11_21400 [soil metagenome]
MAKELLSRIPHFSGKRQKGSEQLVRKEWHWWIYNIQIKVGFLSQPQIAGVVLRKAPRIVNGSLMTWTLTGMHYCYFIVAITTGHIISYKNPFMHCFHDSTFQLLSGLLSAT